MTPQTEPEPKAIWTARVVDATTRNFWIALSVLMASLMITILSALYFKADVEATAKREFDFICNEIELHIANRLAASSQILHGGAGLFDASETVTREEWRLFTEKLQFEKQLPGIQGIGFSLLIPPEQLDQHIEEIRSEGFPEYTVSPAGKRDVYSSIIYIEPFSDRNLRAFGYDMFSEPIRRAAMEKARDENKAVLSGKVFLVQETSQDVQAGALMYLPIYRHGLPIDTVEQRRAAILGWVYSPYRMTDMLNGILDASDVRQKERQISLQVYDGDLISIDTLMYDNQSNADETPASTALISKTIPVDFAGHLWTLRFSLVGGLASTAENSSVWLVLFGGTGISLLLFWLTLSMLRTRVNAQRMADELTTDLRESEEKYSIVFNNEIYAICIYDLETLKILEVNEAFEHVYGYTREEILSGMDIHNITAEQQATDAAIVQVAREGTTFIPLRYHRRKDGTIFPIEIVAGPYTWRGRKVMFALVHDITERLQTDALINEMKVKVGEQELYSVLVEKAADGFWLLDKAFITVYVNPAIEGMLGYAQNEMIGRSWYDFGDPEWIARAQELEKRRESGIPEDHQFLFIHKNGRKVLTRLATTPLYDQDGEFNGALGVLSDITRQKEAQDALEIRDMLDTIAKSSGIGMCIINPDYTIEWFNDLYALWYGDLKNAKGRPCYEVFEGRAEVPPNCPLRKTIKTGETVTAERSGLTTSIGADRDLLLTTSPIRNVNGEVVQVVEIAQDITERKQAEAELQKVSGQLASVMESTSDLIGMVDKRYRYILFNSAFQEEIKKIFGRGVKLGSSMRELLANLPNDFADSTELWDRAFAGEDFITTQQFGDPGVERNWYELHFSPIRDSQGKVINAVHIIRNISERKQAEKTLAISESRYRNLFEAAQDGVLILDSLTGKIMDVNPYLINLLGFSQEQFLEKYIWDIGFAVDMIGNLENFQKLQQEQFIRYDDLPLETAQGGRIHVEFISKVFFVDGTKVIVCNVRDISDRVINEEKILRLNIELEKLANIDGLTGINNHRSLLKLAGREFDVAMRYQPPLSIMFFDIDNFKQINDTFGHAIGDDALIMTIQAVCSKLRSADLIGRYGGDEFVILLPQTTAQDALPLAERIHASIAEMRLDTDRGVLTLTISIGIAQSIHDASQSDTVEELLHRADLALYSAKQAGKNCTMIFDADAAGLG